jgi:uncharacterized HAD superfamily protein
MMQSGLTLGVDLDEVCCDFVTGFLKYYNVRWRVSPPITKSMINDWYWWNIPEIRGEMTEERWKQAFQEFTRARMWQGLDIFPGVQQSLYALFEDGHHICYLTDRPKDARRSTLKFLLHHGLPVDSIVFSNGSSKAKIAKAMGVDIAIDDKPKTLLRYREAGIIPVIMLRGHNAKFSMMNKDIKSVSDLVEFYGFVKDYAQECIEKNAYEKNQESAK